ncbi:raftlin-like [Arapaima gigas]
MRHITPGRGSSVRTSAALRAPSARAVLAKPNVELIRISGRRVVTASSAVGGGLFPGPDLRVWICFELPDDTLLPDVLCFVDSSSKPAACFGRETLLSPLNRCGTTTGEMGCRLPKLKRSDENSPGKIYSTLKRPQVETKVGLAYTYRFLDFILGKDDGTSMLCISSVRELPGQMLELYQQGFVLAAVHPFVHPSGAEAASAQRMLYRAVLVRLSDSVDRPEAKSDNRLEMEVCLSASQVPGTELIQGYVKRIQDAAEQGIAFVGFVQQPSRAFSVLGQEDPDDLSMSLHSSPSSVQGSKAEQNQDPERQSPLDQQDGQTRDCEFEEALLNEAQAGSAGDGEEELPKGQVSSPPNVLPPAEDPPLEITDNSITPDNNNKATGQDSTKDKESGSSVLRRGLELFALFNHPGTGQGLLKYYTVKVPLRIQVGDEGVIAVEASWLDHMTQHFNSGASLVDGYFHLWGENDLPPKTVESVFIFQEGPEGESGAATAYDAIVVEQWTVIDGVAVKTDYIPLLQSLAMYGWRLTCVLPTPVVKTNSDGSLATKQIVFLQRPVLPRKKKESKILSFRTRNKSNKNSVKDAPKEKTKKSESPGSEKETDEQRSGRGEENEEVVRKNIENRPGERTSLETKGDQGPEAEREAGEADGEEAGGGGPGDRPEAAGGSKAAAGGEQAERPEEKDELAEMDDGQQSAGGEEGRGPAGCEESAVLRVSAETERIPEAADPSSDSAPLGSEQ